MPVGRIEILDRFQLQAAVVDFAAQRRQLVDRPQPIGVAGAAPAVIRAGRLVVARVLAAVFEIVDEVGDDVRGAGLSRELEVLAREHVSVEAEAELHDRCQVSGVRCQDNHTDT